jgi:ribose transport system substrate-binding protein
VVGLEGSQDAIDAIRDPESPFQATVEFFPEEYGPALIDVSLRLLRGEQVAPFQYVNHQLLTRQNLLSGTRVSAIG